MSFPWCTQSISTLVNGHSHKLKFRGRAILAPNTLAPRRQSLIGQVRLGQERSGQASQVRLGQVRLGQGRLGQRTMGPAPKCPAPKRTDPKKIISNDMYISYSSYIHTINIVSSSIELLPPPFSHIACNAGIRCRSPYSQGEARFGAAVLAPDTLAPRVGAGHIGVAGWRRSLWRRDSFLRPVPVS